MPGGPTRPGLVTRRHPRSILKGAKLSCYKGSRCVDREPAFLTWMNWVREAAGLTSWVLHRTAQFPKGGSSRRRYSGLWGFLVSSPLSGEVRSFLPHSCTVACLLVGSVSCSTLRSEPGLSGHGSPVSLLKAQQLLRKYPSSSELGPPMLSPSTLTITPQIIFYYALLFQVWKIEALTFKVPWNRASERHDLQFHSPSTVMSPARPWAFNGVSVLKPDYSAP